MKLTIIDTDRLVKVNNLPEVKNSIFFEKGFEPTDDGLFSYVIFGNPGSYDRKINFAYIDLKEPFFNPLVYTVLIALNRKFEKCIAGLEYFKISSNGELEKVSEDDPDGQTGIPFLYKNWEKLKFKYTDSNLRKEKVDFIKVLKKSEIFMTKQIVCPAFYRDVSFNTSGMSSDSYQTLNVDEVNNMYRKLIRYCSSLGKNSEFDFMGNITRKKVQDTLIEIYNYFTNKIKKKNGIFRSAVMGKSVDYGYRSVIASPRINTNTYEEMASKMESTGVPLSQCLVLFFPFFVSWVQEFFEKEYGNKKSVTFYKSKNSDPVQIFLSKDVLNDFTYDEIKKQINLFIKSPTERFNIIRVKTDNGKYIPMYFVGIPYDYSTKQMQTSINRPMTWTDLFFIAANEICKDKHVYITRYPLEDYFGIYPSRIHILSTFKTTPMTVNSVYYPNYPIIDLNQDKNEIARNFIDALEPFNGMLNGLGGDYDGALSYVS